MTKKDRRNEDYGAKLAITQNSTTVGSEAAAEQGRKKSLPLTGRSKDFEGCIAARQSDYQLRRASLAESISGGQWMSSNLTLLMQVSPI